MNNSGTYKNKKIVLGISGGVDSTTAALLLLEKGFEVYGLYFSIKEDDGEKDAAHRALLEAYRAYGIEEKAEEHFIYRNVHEEFNNIVINDFCNEYRNGRTPNPCIVCNPNIKFKLLIEAADMVGAEYISTGHYADTAVDDAGNVYIRKVASKKDQSYMLYRLSQDIIKRIVFPLADFNEKDEIRKIAEDMGMSNAKASDSQEICFIENNTDYVEYIKTRDGNDACRDIKEGNFVDSDGKILGKHKGISYYTIGQRKGLGIALGKPAFVTDINKDENTVTLGNNEELFRTHVIVSDLFFTETGDSSLPPEIEKKYLTAKVRYAAPQAACTVKPAGEGSIEVVFEAAQRAMTPGQSVVIYEDDRVIGGGRIAYSF